MNPEVRNPNVSEGWYVVYRKGVRTIYEINENAEIRSFFRGKWHSRKAYKAKASGYWKCGLKMGRRTYTMSVHRMVGENIIPNPHPNTHKYLNHMDGNKDNNRRSNLEWCTFQMNERHAWDTGLKKCKKGAENHRAKKVGKYFAGILLKTYNAIMETEADGFTRNGIDYAIKVGRTHKGFNWKLL